MLSHTDGLSDHEVEILWELRGSAHWLEDSEDLGSGKVVGLANAVGVSEVNTNERRLVTWICELAWGDNELFFTLLGELGDDVLDFLGGGLLPRWDGSFVRKSGSGDTLSWCVHTAHGEVVLNPASNKRKILTADLTGAL
jgi:hypothetical protein